MGEPIRGVYKRYAVMKAALDRIAAIHPSENGSGYVARNIAAETLGHLEGANGRDERANRVENMAKFLAFAIDGHDQSWACVAEETVEDYRYKAEGLMQCAEGREWEAVLMDETAPLNQPGPAEPDTRKDPG